MLDCNCPKCSGETTEDDFPFHRCLNRENDLEIQRIKLDMSTPFDWLLSPYFFCALAIIFGIIGWN